MKIELKNKLKDYLSDENNNILRVFTALHIIMVYQYFKQNEIQSIVSYKGEPFYKFEDCINGEMNVQEMVQLVSSSYCETNHMLFGQQLFQNIEKVFENIKFELKKLYSSNYEFTMSIIEPEMINEFVIKSDIYGEVLIEQEDELKTVFYMILEQLIDHENILVKDLEVLLDEHKDKILNQFPGKTYEFNKNANIISIFEAQVKRYEHNTAVLYESISRTYKDLNEKVNQIAHYLIEKGMEKENLVAIIIDRSNLMMECILGIWKAGGAYIPIDIEYPAERINDIISDANPTFVIHNFDEENLPSNIVYKRNIINVNKLYEKINQYSKENPNINIDQNQLAYVLYTSGSTGKPKGAMVEHIGMLNHMYAKIMDLRLNENSVIVQNASHCFDISIWQFFVAILLGGKTVIFSNETNLDPYYFMEELVMNGVTDLEVVPSYLDALLDIIIEDEVEIDTGLDHLKNLIVTGERLSKKLVEKWFAQYPNVQIVNAYGPTEASDDITHYIMKESPEVNSVSIGRTILNMRIYIVDKYFNLCPVGIAGEICVAGIGVGRGYLNDIEKTQKAFMADPFVSNQSRLYRTGDYGKWLPDGNIDFIGRKDEQVKIRGFRIELGDVRSLVLKHKDIKDAVVVCKENDLNEKYLCAYVIPLREIKSDELTKVIKQYGPAYMVPSQYVFIDKFPLTSNGKINVKALANY